jgi:hypothetical protein
MHARDGGVIVVVVVVVIGASLDASEVVVGVVVGKRGCGDEYEGMAVGTWWSSGKRNL